MCSYSKVTPFSENTIIICFFGKRSSLPSFCLLHDSVYQLSLIKFGPRQVANVHDQIGGHRNESWNFAGEDPLNIVRAIHQSLIEIICTWKCSPSVKKYNTSSFWLDHPVSKIGSFNCSSFPQVGKKIQKNKK